MSFWRISLRFKCREEGGDEEEGSPEQLNLQFYEMQILSLSLSLFSTWNLNFNFLLEIKFSKMSFPQSTFLSLDPNETLVSTYPEIEVP